MFAPKPTPTKRRTPRIDITGFLPVRQPFWRFGIETTCVLGLFFVVWQFSKLVYVPLLTGPVMRVVRSDQETDILTLYGAAILLLALLAYYGSSFVVTPFSLLRAMLPRVRSAADTHLQIAVDGLATPALGASVEDGTDVGADLDGGSPESILETAAGSAALLAQRMERRTNTHLILGLVMGVLGLLVWYVSFSFAGSGESRESAEALYRTRTIERDLHNLSAAVRSGNPLFEGQSPDAVRRLGDYLPVLDNDLKEIASRRESSWAGLLRIFIPRITILAFIEILAGFFLRQYRVGVEDLKYFLELARTAEARRVAYAIYQSGHAQSDHVLEFARGILSETSAIRLKEGETTTVLETLKAEKNVALEALTIIGDRLSEALVPKKAEKND